MSKEFRAEVRRLLRGMADEFGDVDGLVYRGAGDFLLQHGRWYVPELSRDRVPVGHCYGGAIFVAALKPTARYVEGVAVSPRGDELIPHAWVARGSKAFEITWTQPGLAYIGVEFSVPRADDCTWNGDACVLDDANRNWPLYQQRWTGEDWNAPWPDNDRLNLLAMVRDGKATIGDYLRTMRKLDAEIADG